MRSSTSFRKFLLDRIHPKPNERLQQHNSGAGLRPVDRMEIRSAGCKPAPPSPPLTDGNTKERFGRCTSLLLGLLLLHAAMAQEKHPVSGREIAPVMGMGGAGWLVRSEREAEEAPDAALDAIGIRKGETVADIGAGVGYFTWRMAERVGPTGKVYANDIQPRMLEQLKK